MFQEFLGVICRLENILEPAKFDICIFLVKGCNSIYANETATNQDKRINDRHSVSDNTLFICITCQELNNPESF